MKNILFFLALAFMPCLAGAQTISKDADGNYFAASTAKETGPATLETLTKSATKTAASFTTSKGEKFPVWLSKNGSAFVVRTSKNGVVYRQYMPK